MKHLRVVWHLAKAIVLKKNYLVLVDTDKYSEVWARDRDGSYVTATREFITMLQDADIKESDRIISRVNSHLN